MVVYHSKRFKFLEIPINEQLKKIKSSKGEIENMIMYELIYDISYESRDIRKELKKKRIHHIREKLDTVFTLKRKFYFYERS
jgi:hypothetical protein